MSDAIKHECGIALLRLLKPVEYYVKKYGTPWYGINKLYLMMEKQRNRGQDGAGIVAIKLNVEPGNKYIDRMRSASSDATQDIFQKIHQRIEKGEGNNQEHYWKKEPFSGELLMGHLRYGTHGKTGIENCHPFMRENNWKTRNLAMAGNFNLTNVDELFDSLVAIGQHPKEKSDTVTVMERIGHFLDEENEMLYQEYKELGYNKKEITTLIADQLDIQRLLMNAAPKFDGGYTLAGLIGHGDAFVLRDPAGIRPAYYYQNEEVIVVASERPAIQTAFNIGYDLIKEIQPGYALIIKKDGEIAEKKCVEPVEKRSCSFERIYFSRGSDVDIYQERKLLGQLLTPKVLESLDFDLRNTVFSFIPNTAETAYYGLVKGVEDYLNAWKYEKILAMEGKMDKKELENLLSFRPRVEKVAIKDAKLRTFITTDAARNELVTHVYDVTYGSVNSGEDNLVILDDSIVRGTTLKQSILRILDRLGPKKIIIVSSAPQIRYPDCYGIDMSKMKDFVAFRAAVELLHDTGKEELMEEILEQCKAQEHKPDGELTNFVKRVYEPFSVEEISKKIAEIVTPASMKAQVEVIYQSIENLHLACPNHRGDWYFTGNYPTPGGNKVVNRAFINYMEQKDVRAY